MTTAIRAVSRLVQPASKRQVLSRALGLSTQMRPQEEALRAGSVLLGGWPETNDTAGLFLLHPEGSYTRTVPNPKGITAAQQMISTLNYDPDNGYVHNHMFGFSIEMHLGVGDSWTSFELPRLVGNAMIKEAQVPAMLALATFAVGLRLAVGLCSCSLVLDFVSDGKIKLPSFSPVAFETSVAVEGAVSPLETYMTDLRGLRVQIAAIVLVMCLKIGPTLLLTPVSRAGRRRANAA